MPSPTPTPEPSPTPAPEPSLTPAPEPSRAVRFFRALRWVTAVLVLLVCIYGLVWGSLEVCSVETVTEKAASKVTQKCNSPVATDAAVIAVALLIVLLLIPDLSEVGVFGISLKRRVAAAEAQASKSEAKVDRLQTQLQLFRLETINQAAATASINHNQYFGDQFLRKEDGQALRDRDSALNETPTAPTADGPNSRLRNTPRQPDVTPQKAQMMSSLIWNWEVLAASLDLPPYPRDGRPDIPRLGVSSDEAKYFGRAYAEELRLVRAARNTVAHARPIADEDLRTALDMSERLLGLLAERLW